MNTWRINLCVVSLLLAAAVPHQAVAATIRVTNCNDAGAGSLRAAVAVAASGDTIDLRSLTCSRITLASGRIVLPQDDLSLLGPGRLALTVSAREAAHPGLP